MAIKIYSVREITTIIKEVLEGNFYGIWIEGEVSSLRFSSTGHLYFDLIDEDARIGCLIYKNRLGSIKFKVENGQKVLTYGHLSVYIKGGEYRLIVEVIQQVGKGKKFYDLRFIYEQFRKEGYLDRKRPIPQYPKRILVFTSPTGAAVRDIINIVNRRGIDIELFIYPISVQGDTAKDSILNALKNANALKENVDVAVISRGGGSNEDLWVFNDPEIAKALYNLKFPTISAIGHEIDTTLCDYVADKRVETPSAAAEILTQSSVELKNKLEDYSNSIVISMDRILKFKRQSLLNFLGRRSYLRVKSLIENRIVYLDKLADRLNISVVTILNRRQRKVESLRNKIESRNPISKLQLLDQKNNHLKDKIEKAIMRVFKQKSDNLKLLNSKITALSPLAILNKGYSITLDENGKAIKNSKQLRKGQSIVTVLHKGRISSTVTQITS